MNTPLRTLLYELKNEYKEQPAFLFVEEGRVKAVSYEKFLQDILSQSSHYQQLSQKRIGLWGYNSYQWLTAAVGILLAGCHGIFFDGNLENQDLIYLAEYSDTEWMAVEPELMEEESSIGGHFPMEPYTRRQTEGTAEIRPETDFMCFTSGTSSSSKGVVISTNALSICVREAEGVIPGKRGERYFLPLPLHHIYGFTEVFHVLKRGGTLCLGRGGQYLTEDIGLMDPHIAFFVPTMLQFLLKKKTLPQHLHSVLTGGSYLRPELEQEALSQGLELYNLYGLSETLGMICSSKKEKGSQWLGPFGRIRFFADSDGEILVRLPFHMDGYYKKEEETKQVLDSESHVFRTGDGGEVDGDGWIRIKGRIRDTIVLENGEKIPGEDTDRLICELDGVEEGAVISLNGGLGAVIVPRAGWSEEQIRRGVERFNQKRTVFLRIRHIWLRKEKLPRTSTGKLKRFCLEQEYGKGEINGTSV